jgi:hypothetical protein
MDNKQEYYSSLLLNKTEQELLEFEQTNNIRVCIFKRDDKIYLYPDDKRYDRLDIQIENNIVTKVTFVDRYRHKSNRFLQNSG